MACSCARSLAAVPTLRWESRHAKNLASDSSSRCSTVGSTPRNSPYLRIVISYSLTVLSLTPLRGAYRSISNRCSVMVVSPKGSTTSMRLGNVAHHAVCDNQDFFDSAVRVLGTLGRGPDGFRLSFCPCRGLCPGRHFVGIGNLTVCPLDQNSVFPHVFASFLVVSRVLLHPGVRIPYPPLTRVT
jgi:hypothetical protein